MLAKVHSCAVVGLEGAIVEVEVNVTPGMPSFTIVGLPDTAVQESRQRVSAAVRNAGFYFPSKRVMVNLAPASIRKEGPAYDLPIALGLLLALQHLRPGCLDGGIAVGELSLDGSLRHVRGVLPMAAYGNQEGFHTFFCPAQDAREAALISSLDVIPAGSLTQLANHLNGMDLVPVFSNSDLHLEEPVNVVDFREIKGQEHVKRSLEVAAAGGHNALMIGPPGSGKTLLARSLPSILPRLTIEEALDVTRVYSVADQLPQDQALISTRPFRAPHHTISHAGLVGGGNWPRPGEISLAHRGVLFLDELPEFGTRVLEVMRQPLEDRVVTISRARGSLSFPANFMLLAAMNPCPCGYHGDDRHSCTCSPGQVTRYQKRLSGPLLDRIDIHIDVPRVDFEKLSDDRLGEPSANIRERVEAARVVQRSRFPGEEVLYNSDFGPAELRRFCGLDDKTREIVRQAMRRYSLSARGYHRVLKLARTIADLAGEEKIGTTHLAEALQYRPKLLL